MQKRKLAIASAIVIGSIFAFATPVLAQMMNTTNSTATTAANSMPSSMTNTTVTNMVGQKYNNHSQYNIVN